MKERSGSDAFTLVETIVVAVLGFSVLSVMMGLWSGGSRMSRAAEGSSLLQGALVLEDVLIRDVRQLGHDPRRRESFLLSDGCLSFYRTVFTKNDIRLRPVRFSRVNDGHGNFYLNRAELLPGKKLQENIFRQALLSQCRFSLIQDRFSGNRYLRFEFTVIDRSNEKVRKASDSSSTHSLVLRIPTPSDLGNPALKPATRILPEADFLPLAL